MASAVEALISSRKITGDVAFGLVAAPIDLVVRSSAGLALNDGIDDSIKIKLFAVRQALLLAVRFRHHHFELPPHLIDQAGVALDCLVIEIR